MKNSKLWSKACSYGVYRIEMRGDDGWYTPDWLQIEWQYSLNDKAAKDAAKESALHSAVIGFSLGSCRVVNVVIHNNTLHDKQEVSQEEFLLALAALDKIQASENDIDSFKKAHAPKRHDVQDGFLCPVCKSNPPNTPFGVQEHFSKIHKKEISSGEAREIMLKKFETSEIVTPQSDYEGRILGETSGGAMFGNRRRF